MKRDLLIAAVMIMTLFPGLGAGMRLTDWYLRDEYEYHRTALMISERLKDTPPSERCDPAEEVFCVTRDGRTTSWACEGFDPLRGWGNARDCR